MTLSFDSRFISRFLMISLMVLVGFNVFPQPVLAISLDPYPVYDSFNDESSISFFREERPNYFWVNTGVPDIFFNGVKQNSNQPSNVSYAVNGIEYGIRLSHWMTDQWRVTGTIPFEANALVDAQGNTHTVDHFGDIEIGTTYLLTGERQKGNFIGLDGWYRLATGTNPFTQSYPLLSSGRGASSEALGVVMGQQLWHQFSFFESFHYETTQPVAVSASNTVGLPAGTFQWPSNIEAMGRIEWNVFQRGDRKAVLFYQYSGRISGLMTFNGEPLTYGQSYAYVGNQLVLVGTTNQLFWSTFGALIQVDQEFTAEVDVSQYPVYFIQQLQAQPNSGLMFSLSLIFRPF